MAVNTLILTCACLVTLWAESIISLQIMNACGFKYILDFAFVVLIHRWLSREVNFVSGIYVSVRKLRFAKFYDVICLSIEIVLILLVVVYLARCLNLINLCCCFFFFWICIYTIDLELTDFTVFKSLVDIWVFEIPSIWRFAHLQLISYIRIFPKIITIKRILQLDKYHNINK